ncbi:MAG TPA: hypothetical protein VKU87_10485 [Thermomicrobiaceae bacterium]|nr:hypothetical protein [Thermomicrobiaceae bacterium]
MTHHASIQDVHIRVDHIEDDIVFLVGGEARAVVAVSGVDFPHQGATEQAALVAGFASFLNSLTFPIQILLRAVPLDVSRLVSDLEDRLDQLPPELVEFGRDHSLFLRGLARERTLLDRQSFVVIPSGDDTRLLQRRWWIHRRADMAALDAIRWQLLDRCEEVTRGLGRCALTVRRLESAELLRLFASCWCPGQTQTRLAPRDLLATTTAVVQSRPVNKRRAQWSS